MNASSSRSTEWAAAICCVALGIGVSACIAPKSMAFFLPNLLYFWLPQASILGLLGLVALFRPVRPAALAGASFALAVYLAAFGVWVFSLERQDAMVWLGYLFSFPGAAIGLLLMLAWIQHQREQRGIHVAMLVALGVGTGLALNQAIICSTVMACRQA